MKVIVLSITLAFSAVASAASEIECNGYPDHVSVQLRLTGESTYGGNAQDGFQAAQLTNCRAIEYLRVPEKVDCVGNWGLGNRPLSFKLTREVDGTYKAKIRRSLGNRESVLSCVVRG